VDKRFDRHIYAVGMTYVELVDEDGNVHINSCSSDGKKFAEKSEDMMAKYVKFDANKWFRRPSSRLLPRNLLS
jgi:hypothetical protein